MKRKLLMVFSILATAVMSLLAFLPANNNFVTAAENVSNSINAIWLIDEENNVYASNRTVGTASGYGEFRVGTQNVEIQTTANAGFQLVGWQLVIGVSSDSNEAGDIIESLPIVVTDEGSTQFVDCNGLTEGAKNYVTKSGVTYTLTFVDSDSDGYYESGTFNISVVQNNAPLKIRPVYDYIYQNIELDSKLVSYLNLGSNAINVNGLTINYSQQNSASGTTTYSNAIVVSGVKSYFFETIKTTDGVSFYTEHLKEDGGSSIIKVDVTKGAYRENDSVNLSLAVKDSINIDAQTASYNQSNLTKLESGIPTEAGTFSIAKDSTLRTTNIYAKINVASTVSQAAKFTITAHELKVATLKLYVDNAEIGADADILKAVRITNYYSQIDDYHYFVKRIADNGAMGGLKVTATLNITAIIEGKAYYYYSFQSINDIENNSYHYSDIEDDVTIAVKYQSYKYTVNFEFRLLSNSVLSDIDGTFNLEEDVYLGRGESKTITKTDVSNNTGYKFHSFALSEALVNPETRNTSIDVTMHSTMPKNITILMVYEKIDYTITVTNYNKISLTDNQTPANTYYAIKTITLARFRNNVTNNHTETSINQTGTQPISNPTFNLDDTITIQFKLNRGFKISAYNFENNFEADKKVSISNSMATFTLTSEIIEKFISGTNPTNTVLSMFVQEEFETYTVSLQTQPKDDGVVRTIMADIAVKVGETSYAQGGETVSLPTNVTIKTDFINDPDPKHGTRITISGLKLYQVITFSAAGKDYGEMQYMFVRFTQNFISSLKAKNVQTYSADCDYEVNGVNNTIIYADFSVPKAQFLVELDNENAYEFSDVKIIIGGSDYTGNLPVEVNNGAQIRVELVGDSFAFGYALKGYTLTQGQSEPTVSVTDELYYEFTIESSAATRYVLTINTRIVQYKLYAFQCKDVTPTEITPIIFGESEYKILRIDDAMLEFTMPTGYYVGKVEFKNALEEWYSYEAMTQTNTGHLGIQYSKDLSANLSELAEYGVEDGDYIKLTMKVTYTLHTYEFIVNYGMQNSKPGIDEQINYPKITLTYNTGIGNVQAERFETSKNVKFLNIPHGASVKLVADSNISKGLSAFGWAADNYNKRPDKGIFTTTEFSLDEMTSAETLYYKLKYEIYTLNVTFNNLEGNPIIKVNEEEYGTQAEISLYDRLTIKMNPLRVNGFKFKRMTFAKLDYVRYVYTETSWEELWKTLYKYEIFSGNYVLNTSSTYNQSQPYYQLLPVTQVFDCYEPYYYDETEWVDEYLTLFIYNGGVYRRNTSSEYDPSLSYFKASLEEYVDSQPFSIANYYADENLTINFNVEYEPFEMMLTHSAELAYGSANLTNADINIGLDDYSTYTASVVNSLGETEQLTDIRTVKTTDFQLIITVKLNTHNLNNSETYNLSKGVKLNKVTIEENEFEIISNSTDASEYTIAIYVSELIDIVPASGVIKVWYEYSVQTKRVTLTTNITDPTFYNQFSLNYNNSKYGWGGDSGQTADGSIAITNPLQFLAKSYYFYENKYYYLNTQQEKIDLFYVKDIKVYKAAVDSDGDVILRGGNLVKGDLIAAQDYAKYGVLFKSATYGAVRSVENIVIELQIQPNIIYNTDMIDFNNDGRLDYVFTSEFSCNSFGEGFEQTLSCGPTNESHIQAGEIVINNLDIVYKLNGNVVTPKNSGVYNVSIKLNSTSEEYKWMNSIELLYDVFFIIEQKELNVSCILPSKFIQTYNCKNTISFSNFVKGTGASSKPELYFTDGDKFKVSYAENSKFKLLVNNIMVYITYYDSIKKCEVVTCNASDNVYNLVITGLQLAEDSDPTKPFLNNFVITNSSIDILDSDNNKTTYSSAFKVNFAIKIEQATIALKGVKVNNKVYDGTTKATLNESSLLRWDGILPDDEGNIDAPIIDEKQHKVLNMVFTNKYVGECDVEVDASKLLTGKSAQNYKIAPCTTKATIYPYSVTAKIDDVGEITVYNERGLTDVSKANLIPVGAVLKVEVIELDSNEYVDIYPNITKYLAGYTSFAIGYKLEFRVEGSVGTYQNVSKYLYLEVPKMERFTDIVWLTGKQSDTFVFEDDSERITVDLNNITTDTFDVIFLTKQRSLLSWWQITLIIVAAALVIAGVVVVFLVIRKRKLEGYSVFDKI